MQDLMQTLLSLEDESLPPEIKTYLKSFTQSTEILFLVQDLTFYFQRQLVCILLHILWNKYINLP